MSGLKEEGQSLSHCNLNPVFVRELTLGTESPTLAWSWQFHLWEGAHLVTDWWCVVGVKAAAGMLGYSDTLYFSMVARLWAAGRGCFLPAYTAPQPHCTGSEFWFNSYENNIKNHATM